MSWFETWFDSPYYHILYKDRDEREAKLFIDKIFEYLVTEQGSKVWDLCCGKGRHSLELSKKGFHVTGTDLSQSSIGFALEFNSANLDFFVHDMREPFYVNYFNVVLNLFTSFGYFDKPSDDLKVIQSVYDSLRKGGNFVFDFFNAVAVEKKLVPSEVRTIDGIEFNITRKITDNFVRKDILFFHDFIEYKFSERVKLIDKDYMENLLRSVGFQTLTSFGNYNLEEFNPIESERLILICTK